MIIAYIYYKKKNLIMSIITYFLVLLVIVLYIIINDPPKPQGFVFIPLRSFTVSFIFKVGDNKINIHKIYRDKENIKELLEKDKGQPLDDKERKTIKHLEKEYPDAFIREDNASFDEVLSELGEYLEDIHQEEENKAREVWKNTHPPIPVTDWSKTASVKADASNAPSSKPLQGTSTSDPSPQSSYLPVNTTSDNPLTSDSSKPLDTNSDSTLPKATDTNEKKASPIDYVVDQMETEMPSYTDVDD